MCTAVDDVHHRNGENISIGTTDITVQGDVEIIGGGVGHGKAYAQNGVGAEFALGRSAVELDHGLVDGPLLEC